MTDYLLIAAGVIIGVVFPVIRGFIMQEFPPTGAPGLPPWVKKYGALLIFSLITAVIVLAIYRSAEPEKDIAWYAALILGFSWESVMEKFFTSSRV
ncbi:hypothetical protein [Streptomyces sp. NPDC050600]|uniref:hypothetical protein n=1 Tax=Streptomyces sp. NPDC050600 TaxID=3157213 RepID=UPI00341F88EA